MKNTKLKEKIKKVSIVSLVALTFSPTVLHPTIAWAAEADSQKDSGYVEVSIGDLLSGNTNFGTDSVLPKNKEAELAKLKKRDHLSNKDTEFLKQQYLENHASNPLSSSKWKTSAAKAAYKVAAPILKKFAKKAGVKLTEHGIASVIDILTGVEDNIQGRLYTALRHMGFSKKWAGITSRAIMFVLF